jgi:uncharacterized membrane protein YqiK
MIVIVTRLHIIVPWLHMARLYIIVVALHILITFMLGA